MVYVEVLAKMLKIDLDAVSQALDFHFKSKQKPIELNFGVIKAAYIGQAVILRRPIPYIVEPMNATQDCILATGTRRQALGAIFGGVQLVAWYPITPATSLAEALMEYLPLLRKDPLDPTKNTFAIVQAEDELAAIGMAVGAGWAGLRAMTSSSGPGISLMAEYAGPGIFCGGAHCGLGRPACWSEHGPPHSHRPGRSDLHSFHGAWRHPAGCPVAGICE